MKRKLGPARTPSLKDGLTRAQAEERMRKLRDADQALARDVAEGVTGKNGGEVSVTTFDANGAPMSSGFHLIVVC